MESVYFRVSLAATAAAFVLSLPAYGADAPTAPAAAVNATPAATAPLPSQRVAGNGGVHGVGPAASAASGPGANRNVQTTVEDGRTVTRNAHDRHATDEAQTPND